MSNAQARSVMVQGRMVWTIGDLFAGDIAKVYGTQQPKVNKQGQQFREYGFGLAVPKSLLAQAGPGQPGEIWAALHEVAYTMFPNRVIPKDFAMKYSDGDTDLDKNGQPLSLKEGYAGCIVLSCKSTFAPKFFRYENGAYTHVSEGINSGDYVQVSLTVDIHGAPNAGLYLNPQMVLLLQKGKEIINAPSATQVFGTQAPAIPAWMPQTPQNAAPPMQSYAPPVQPAAPVQPHHAVLPAAFQPQPGAMPALPNYAPGAPNNPNVGFAPPAAPGYPQNLMVANGAGFTAPNPAYPGSPGTPPVPGMNR